MIAINYRAKASKELNENYINMIRHVRCDYNNTDTDREVK